MLEKARRTNFLLHTAQIQIPCALFVIAGVLLVAGNSTALYWLVPAAIFVFVEADQSGAWMILVEINRARTENPQEHRPEAPRTQGSH